MPTQKALIVKEIGGRVVEVSDWPIAQPGPKQVQIRVTVAGLNPHDQKGRDGGLFIKDNLPAILGNDVAGVVTEVGSEVTKFKVGSEVTKFKVGDRIFAQSAIDAVYRGKALQQYALVEEDHAAKIPNGISEHGAATLPINAITAVVALFHPTAGLGLPAPWTEEAKTFDYAGTTLLIIGGGSNCGRFGIQVAKLAGIGKIVVVGGKESELKPWGATHVLDRHGGDDVVLKRIRDVAGDDLVYAYDCINGPDKQYLGVSALSNTKKGKLARALPSGPIDESKILGGREEASYELADVFGASHLKAETTKPFWDRVGEYLKDGQIVPVPYVVEEGLDADKVNALLDRYRDGKPVTQTQFRISE
ncbi:putative alcohol dehydrogenase [Lophiotrema nucula]|uniref:Putative alcohol dehydrogenase n=1 Tax=Lophiotrema nucula TaxID=690887 RepID=A0A6A5ZKU3_9PLEO|nr:putative alcohol dehydrogenase [Lophiotrema nucula]